LRNVRERLNVLFGGRASLTAGRPERGHYEVRIRLPLRHDAGSLFQIYRESA